MEMCNRPQATKQQRSGITWRKKKNKQNNNKQNKKRKKKEEGKGKKESALLKKCLGKNLGVKFLPPFLKKKNILFFFRNFEAKIRPFGEGVAIYIYIYKKTREGCGCLWDAFGGSRGSGVNKSARERIGRQNLSQKVPSKKGSLGVIFSPRNYRQNAHSKSANFEGRHSGGHLLGRPLLFTSERKTPGRVSGKVLGNFSQHSRNATNSKISGTGKGKPAANLGSTLPGPCPNLPCGVFFEIDSSSP